MSPRTLIPVMAAVLFTAGAAARAADPPEPSLDATARAKVVSAFVHEMGARYIFPAKVASLQKALEGRLHAGAYDGLGGTAFAKSLTADAFGVLHDKHVSVTYRAAGFAARNEAAQPTATEIRAAQEEEARLNYGVERVQRLQGDIGYLEIRGLASADGSAAVLGAALELLSHTQGLIVDLRRNHGGDPETVSLLCSYLLPPDQRVHVNDLAERDGNTEHVEQFWTSRVPGPYYLDRPVYVLTSATTASGAEELAYDLQNLRRATIVGETTAGAANPGGVVLLTPNFRAFIPGGRAVSPITHTNWEGIGVKPDLPVPAADALKTAYRAAVQKQLERTTDTDLKTMLRKLAGDIDQMPADRILDS